MADPMLSMKMASSVFFDRPRVRSAMDAATRRSLSKAGAYIRQSAKTSMRKKKGPSPPGKPPHAHAGTLRRLMFFAYDRNRKSVVVGPLKFRKGEAPRRLEFGATFNSRPRMVRMTKPVGSDQKGRFLSRGDRVLIQGRVTIKPRPYMRPAMARELPKLPRRWSGAVKGG